MRNNKIPCMLLFSCLFLFACSSPTPEKYFDVAVLNTNMLVGFAGEVLPRDLESPSVKLEENNSEPVQMTRSEMMSTKIKFLDENFEKLKDLKETEDTKEMLQASIALYKFVLPVYKTEYTQLAGLFDSNAPKDQIQSLAQSIHDKYYLQYKELEAKLISIGKIYAEKNNIKVNWGVY